MSDAAIAAVIREQAALNKERWRTALGEYLAALRNLRFERAEEIKNENPNFAFPPYTITVSLS